LPAPFAIEPDSGFLSTTLTGPAMSLRTSSDRTERPVTDDAPGTPDVIVFTDPRSPAAEAYRTLRTNVHALLNPPGGRPLHVILMTSAGAGEGKSEAIANLATSFAQGGLRVAVVDADFRLPAQHLRFALPNTVGLADYVTRGDLSAPIPMQPSTVKGLSILTSGAEPESPADILASGHTEAVLSTIANDADIVLVDCPPVCAFADASVLATRVDGVVIVVGAGVVKRDLARQARAQLEAVRANVLGIVVTNAAFSERAFASYYEGAPGSD
jgi:non-specific protein-tyrosine kinase